MAVKDQKEKKKSVGPLTFLRQVRAEGNKVTWTSRQETIQATIFVLIMSILIGLSFPDRYGHCLIREFRARRLTAAVTSTRPSGARSPHA